MNKGTHFIGQPMYGQLINLLDKSEILKFSRKHGGKRYVKRFDAAWQHLSDANSRRSKKVFESVYCSLYARYRDRLSSDSRKRQVPSWLTDCRSSTPPR